MDVFAENQQESGDVSVIVVENEAESMQEEKSGAPVQAYLDTCPVCHLNFHTREPKLLPCLHSFCKKCLPSPSRNLATTEPPNQEGDSANKPLNVLCCPVCRQECMAVDVMDNVFVKDSAEAPSSTVEKTVQRCMTCDDNTEAAGFCVDCVEYLCATCVDAHQRVKFTKDHMIKQRTNDSQDVHGVSTKKPMFCEIHKQEPVKLFCETCDLLTCRDCQLIKHKDHSYQFLDDAYKNHKQHMETMTQQLHEKKKHIEEVSNSINTGLLLVDKNRTTVHNEIKTAISSLIIEINKKGKMLVNQLEAVTKDHERVLRKQQEDIGYLSRHLDHVISFTKWATARNGGMALLYCKRLILFQIENLLQAKCSVIFVPRSTVHFQSQASYWASNVDLGSLVVESVPGHQFVGCQGIPHQSTRLGHGPSRSTHSFSLGASHSTLAQLQMQVDKLNPQADWQPQLLPPSWTWYQCVRLQPTVPGLLRGVSTSHSTPPQPGRGSMLPPSSHILLRGTGSIPSCQTKSLDVFSSISVDMHETPLSISGGVSLPQSEQTTRPAYVNKIRNSAEPVHMGKPNYPICLQSPLPIRNVQGQQTSPGYAVVSQEEKPGTASWKPPKTHNPSEMEGSAVKKRRRSSPGPVIVIKEEIDDDSSYAYASQRASLPDSTDDQPISSQSEGNKVSSPFQSTDDKPHRPSRLDQCKTRALDRIPLDLKQQPVDQTQAGLEEASCAVCQTGGELLCCHKCSKVFHLTCHVPTLLKSPSGKWFCSFCRDLLMSEMEYYKPETQTEKKETDFEGGLTLMERRKCERLLLHLFCSELSSDFQEPVSPLGPMNLSFVKQRLEAEQRRCYQSPAEFVSDIRLIFGKCADSTKADIETSTTWWKLRELFEEHLKLIFPDQSFPEIKLEALTVANYDSQLSPLDSMSQLVKHQRTCSHPQEKRVLHNSSNLPNI
ncbi:E3 ubiquitin-protein ligase TRIM33-like [Melanotaenia boesemani]|uniref:E3 ubiquitin-protein ligase TRIM33-like n=1 Tax=Melanotaenia boesemani TaxID=1250792 RepID=UPI001C052630|nr:E3 ubiquitin-protein ligase TRIM33-like [Melanotaenia boesemani]